MCRMISILIMAFAITVIASSGIVHAQYSVDKGESVSEGEVINKTCPVMGGNVERDTPYKTVYKGETIGFCCPGCVKSFEADPEKYINNIEIN